MKTRLFFFLLPTFAFLSAALADLPNTDKQLFQAPNAVNYLANPGFENSMSDWTKSVGGGFEVEKTTAAMVGAGSIKFSPTGATQYFESVAKPVSPGLAGGSCVVAFHYASAEATNLYKVQVLDNNGADLVIDTATNAAPLLPATSSLTSYANAYYGFACPSTGTVKVKISSTGTASPLRADQFVLGSDYRLFQVSQSYVYGRVTTPVTANCSWNGTGKQTTPGTLPADADCPVATTEGRVSAPTTKIPAVRLVNAPAGYYRFEMRGTPYSSISSGACNWRFTDGTNIFGKGSSGFQNSVYTEFNSNVVGEHNYTTAQADITVQMYAIGSNDNVICSVENGEAYTGPFEIVVYYFPTGSETSMRIDETAWHVTANITTGTGINIAGLTDTVPFAADPVLSTENGSSSAQISCVGTEESSGNTCSGDEQAGLSFTVPYTGVFEVCADTDHYTNGSSINNTFQLAETANNSQTKIQSGILSQVNGHGGTLAIYQKPVYCYDFNFTSTGKKTVRMFANGAATDNYIFHQRWTVNPKSVNSNSLVKFSGLVTSTSAGRERIERVVASQGVACTSGVCPINNSSSDWVQSITWFATGSYNVVVKPGVFSGPPACWGTSASGTLLLGDITSPTAFSLQFKGSGWADVNAQNIILSCMGPN